jgi:hypothetical protein
VVVVGVVALLVAAGVVTWFSRPRHNSLLEHHRAIETLREIAEHPVAAAEPATPHPHYPTDHVLLLPEPSDRVGRDRRRSPSGRAGSLRPVDADYSSRPTIARLPTIGPALHLESLQLGSPAALPSSVIGEDSPDRLPGLVMEPDAG